MPESHVVWLNGEILPTEAASISIADAAVTSGVTVTERLRTFGHEPFLLGAHLDRLFDSARAAWIDPPVSKQQLGELVQEIVARNAKLLAKPDDLSVSVWLSAGRSACPSLCVGAVRIPAARYAQGFTKGISLVVPPTKAIDPESLDPAIKSRNRLHWHIADRQAEAIDPAAAALLADRHGHVTETATANIFTVIDGRLLTPPLSKTLAGISRRYLLDLARRLGQKADEADLTVDDLLRSQEVFRSSSVSCLQPVVRINQHPVGSGRPGPIFELLLDEWSKAVGVNIAAQMRRMADETRV